jgi:hypothetical protein
VSNKAYFCKPIPLREGQPYIVNGASPRAHLTMHAAVEEMIEGGNADVKAAYEKLLTTGVNRHHAIHILAAIFLQFCFDAAHADERGEPPDKASSKYERTLRKICTDSAIRRKWARRISGDHAFLEAEE